MLYIFSFIARKLGQYTKLTRKRKQMKIGRNLKNRISSCDLGKSIARLCIQPIWFTVILYTISCNNELIFTVFQYPFFETLFLTLINHCFLYCVFVDVCSPCCGFPSVVWTRQPCTPYYWTSARWKTTGGST